MRTIINYLREDSYFIKKIILTSTSRGLAALGTFLLNLVLAKTLSIIEYGSYMLCYTIMIGVSFFVKFGMPTAILRFVSVMFTNNEYHKINKLKRQVNILFIILSTICVIFLVSFKNYVSTTFFNENVSLLIIIFCLVIPFYSYLNVQSSFIKAYKKPELAPFLEVGFTAFLTSGIVLGFYYLKLIAITKELVGISFLFSNILVIIFGYYLLSSFTKKSPLKKSIDSVKFLTTLPDYALTSITTYVLKFSPILVLGFFLSEDKVGLYSIANSITFTISFVLWIISAVYAPHYASLHSEGKNNELRAILKKSTLYMLCIAFPIFTIIMIFPLEILSLFGENYTEAVFGVRILAVAQLFNIITGPVYFLLNMTGYQNKLRNIVLFTMLICVSASFILIPMYGFVGAIYATSLGLLLQNSLAYYYSKKLLRI